MENESFILTVAIPTYNRAETLEKIINQLGRESNQSFYILISDDNSSDDTEVMVAKYRDKMPNLIYHKNETNLGFSGNVCAMYELAKTRYLWFLCDDDTVLPGAIDDIIKALTKYEPVVAVFNATWIDSFGRKLTAGPSKDFVYDDLDLLDDYQPLMRTTFLSILVVEKRLPVDIIKATDYKDNVFFQVTLALMLLSDKFKYCEVASSIVHRNVGYKYGEFFKFNLLDHLKAAFIINHAFDNKKFIKWSKRKILYNLQLYLSQKLGLFKYCIPPNKQTRRNLIKYYGFSSIFLMCFPIIYFLTPKLLLKSAYALRLITIHGFKEWMQVYRQNINRAAVDTRKTKFTAYR